MPLNGTHPVFAALAFVDPQQFLLQVHVLDIETAQLLIAQPGGVKHFQQRPVTIANERLGVRRFDQAAGFLRRQDVPGQAVRLPGQPQALGRVAGDVALLRQKSEEVADGNEDVILRADAAGRALECGRVKDPALKVLHNIGRDRLRVGDFDFGQKFGEAVEVKLMHLARGGRVVEQFQLLQVAVEQHVKERDSDGMGFKTEFVYGCIASAPPLRA